ncbi:MAG: type IV pilin protein [Pseudomonadota bacterium]
MSINAKQTAGFSLTELMIVVSIITILGAFALPSFTNQIRRSNRTDATAALMRVAAEQEKFYLQNNSYGDMSELNDPVTDAGYYTLTIPTANATTYTITATPTEGGPQVNDAICASFSINAAGQRTAVDTTGGDTSTACW